MNKHIIQSSSTPTKLHNGWIKPVVVLFLLIVLQAFYCCGNKDELGRRIKNSQELSKSIDNCINISIKENGSTYLHDAVRTCDAKNVEVVLNRMKKDKETGKNDKYEDGFPNSIDAKAWTPLGLAIKGGNLEIVRLLLSEDLIDLNKVGHKLTSFLLALNENQSKIAEYLLKCDRIDCDSIDITSTDQDTGESPLHIAIRQQFGALVETLVQELSKQNPQALLKKDKRGMTVLDTAALYKNGYGFPILFEEILKMFPDKVDQFVNQFLFKEDPKKPSVFALAYAPVPSSSSFELLDLVLCCLPADDDDYNGKDMFECVLHTIKKYLKEEHWERIEKEINLLPKAKKSDVEQLLNIVKKVKFGSQTNV